MRSILKHLLCPAFALLLTAALMGCGSGQSIASQAPDPVDNNPVSASSEEQAVKIDSDNSEESVTAAEKDLIYYFYEEICASCDPKSEFFDLVQDRMQGITLPEDYSISCYNVFTDQTDLFSSVCDAQAIPEEERSLPMLITSAGYASGEENIRQQLRYLICTHYGIEDDKTLWYYYRPECKDCIRIEPFLEEMLSAYPEYSVIRIDTTDPDPKAAFKEKLSLWEVPQEQWQVPFLTDGIHHLSGDVQIEAELQQYLEGRSER